MDLYKRVYGKPLDLSKTVCPVYRCVVPRLLLRGARLAWLVMALVANNHASSRHAHDGHVAVILREYLHSSQYLLFAQKCKLVH